MFLGATESGRALEPSWNGAGEDAKPGYFDSAAGRNDLLDSLKHGDRVQIYNCQPLEISGAAEGLLEKVNE